MPKFTKDEFHRILAEKLASKPEQRQPNLMDRIREAAKKAQSGRQNTGSV